MGLKSFCLYLAVAILLSHQGMAQDLNSDVSQNEYLLEEASCAKVLETLKGALPEVHFTAMPNLNGFYATGSESEQLKIQIKLLYLDRVPPPPGPPLREHLPEKYKALMELRGFTIAPQYPCDSRHYRVLYP